MLADYFRATVPQLTERARLLKGKIPHSLPRDYDALIRTCDFELDHIIERLDQLQSIGDVRDVALHHTRLRIFRRAVADLDHIETTGIAVLNRAHEDDHRANRLLYAICTEIRYPWITPTVATLSKGYFYIYPKLNLMFIPPAEGSFLLHLPDLYHELGHPLLTPKNHPVLDRFLNCYLKCTAKIHDYFADRRDVEESGRGPLKFLEDIDRWEILWSRYWLIEFFCDLFAAATVGPAFAWAHLHLYLKSGGHAFRVTEGVHPSDDARMRAILGALRHIGFGAAADSVQHRWEEALGLAEERPDPDYIHCYPRELMDVVVAEAVAGVVAMGCHIAFPQSGGRTRMLLNEAWERFWNDPDGYHRWEAEAVKGHLEGGGAD